VLSNYLIKSIDALAFAGLIYLNIQYYGDHYFYLISILAMLYIMVRRRDINTISLVIIILIPELTNLPIFPFNPSQFSNSYLQYSSFAIMNAMIVMFTWLRPKLLLKYGGSLIKDQQTLHTTYQDVFIGVTYGLHTLFQVAYLLEHLIRHLDDIGLEGLFGHWEPMLIYNMYPIQQFGYTIFALAGLYYMTFDISKEKLRL
jgi:hypothetical protein